MTECPACAKPVTPDDAACPTCGIALHHDTSNVAATGNRGPAPWLFPVLAAVIGGGLLLLVCSGLVGLLAFRATVARMPVATPVPAPPVVVTPATLPVAPGEMLPEPAGLPTPAEDAALPEDQPPSEE